jgi:hypothetical protein
MRKIDITIIEFVERRISQPIQVLLHGVEIAFRHTDLWQKMWFTEDLVVWSACIFAACDPLPPGKAKAREFLDSLKMKLVPVRAEN